MTQRSAAQIYVLSGGAGTRLWPLSRESFPKQFYDLTHSGKPLLVNTLNRLQGFGALSVLTTENLRFASVGILKQFNVNSAVVGEPEPKNTAPAVALATALSLKKNPNSIVGIFPADHFISDLDSFRNALSLAFKEAEKGQVVTLGIQPKYPATGYGYMLLKKGYDKTKLEALPVERFVEKPSLDKATELLSTSRAVWNAGMFVFSAKKMAELFEKFMPEMWNAFKDITDDATSWKKAYTQAPAISLDYAVIEKFSDLLCIPCEMGWSDVGSWEEVANRSQTLGDPVEVEGHHNFYSGHLPSAKRVAFVGVSDMIVIDTPDALMVTKQGEGQKVKEVVAKLKKEGSSLLKAHAFEDRPWGRYEVLSDTPFQKTRKISVWPGQKLSYQSHKKRAEHWVIVRGQAEVTLNDKIHQLRPGDHIYIPLEAKHRIANPGHEVMEFIEVQSGSYFGEDDIIRYSDDYGRS